MIISNLSRLALRDRAGRADVSLARDSFSFLIACYSVQPWSFTGQEAEVCIFPQCGRAASLRFLAIIAHSPFLLSPAL